MGFGGLSRCTRTALKSGSGNTSDAQGHCQTGSDESCGSTFRTGSGSGASWNERPLPIQNKLEYLRVLRIPVKYVEICKNKDKNGKFLNIILNAWFP